MYLALVTTARCNAACAHCSASCGPDRDEHLQREHMLRLMDEAARLSQEQSDGWLHISITGGEPFLDFPLLLTLVAHAHRLGANVSCVSNAYWASTDQKALELLTQLQRAGLNLLAISASSFHEAFVRRSRVERALRTARALKVRTQLKVVRTTTEATGTSPLTRWARSAGADLLQFIPLTPSLRKGATVPASEFADGGPLPAGRCPASILSVDESGTAYPCCTPGASGAFFTLGNTFAEPLREIHGRLMFGGKQQILREQGPDHFARAVIERGHGDRLRSSYVDVCDLCTHIGRDPVMAGIAEEAAKVAEHNQLRSMLGSLAEAKNAN